MTTVYFIRHAEPDISIHDEMYRPLTAKGLMDAKSAASFLKTRISIIYIQVHI